MYFKSVGQVAKRGLCFSALAFSFCGTTNLLMADPFMIPAVNPVTGVDVGLDIENSPVGGNKDVATVYVVEFKAFDCPPCRTLDGKMKSIKQAFEQDERVAFVHKFGRLRTTDDPMKMAYCAAKLDGMTSATGQVYFNKAKNILFANPRTSTASFMSQLMLRDDQRVEWNACFASAQSGADVLRDRTELRQLSLTGFPTINIDGRELEVNVYDANASNVIMARIRQALEN